MIDRVTCALTLALALSSPAGAQDGEPPITFNTNFEGGSIGKIEKLSPFRFRCFVQGQHDERGRNRQASWYYFRMDQVRGRDLTLTLTDLVGEYNDKPGACPAGPDIIPVFSEDGGRTWRHFADSACSWDDLKKEMTLAFRPGADSLAIAHVPPYTPADLGRLLAVREGPTSTTNALSREHGVPVVLMEQRIGTSRKLGRRPTVADRLTFGRDLVRVMAEAVR